MTARPRVIEVHGWHAPAPERTAVASVSRDAHWRQFGRCGEIGGEAFFPEKGGSVRAVKRVCQGCPVTEQCLKFALDNQIHEGVFGGLSERERRPLLAERRERNGLAA